MKAVIFDMDGTLVRYAGPFQSSWDAIGAAAGLKEEWARLLDFYLPKKELYSEWLQANASSLKGVSFETVSRQVLPPPYTPAVPETMAHLAGSYHLGILTSGVDFIAEYIRNDLHMNFAMANKLYVSNGLFTGEIAENVHLWRKGEVLDHVCRKQGWPLNEVCFVGDHLNDIPAMEIAGYSIAFDPKKQKLADAADAVTHDFREIPNLIAAWETR
ncbi:MAG: HAD family phosphatase [Candidatus Aenigmarchaeota archaeon]|nr:HAD family phosphatase [Candidatus Aenigmarchaeota archaeon]